MKIDLTDEQIYLLYELEKWFKNKTSPLFQISGSPGTGKSTIIKYFIERMGLDLNRVLFMCYMGKACTRLVQSGIPAKTIHSSIYKCVRKKKRDEEGRLILNKKGNPIYTFDFLLKESLPKKTKLIIIDEASMVPKDIAEDILSFNIPVITLGDLNQLPPVFGNPYFLTNVDFHLTKIMRQSEGDPIIFLSQQVLGGNNLEYGLYGDSAVIRKEDLNDNTFKTADIILTGTNAMRHNINHYMRKRILEIPRLDRPYLKEKLLCCKNNWNISVDDKDEIFLMNGLIGYVERVYNSEFSSNRMYVDFRPDFVRRGVFKHVDFNYRHLMDPENIPAGPYDNIMEFGYAVTTHKIQGSEADNVLYIHEDFTKDREFKKKLMYTAITRAKKRIIIVK